VPAGQSAVSPPSGAVVRRLVIVESPAKARKIGGYLGDGYVVEASVGHIRDLPTRAADIPSSHKSRPWARLGVDVDNAFQTLYVIDADKRRKVSELKALLANSDELLLATDEDREGEAIAWHLKEVLAPKVPVRRMVFHEITRDAIRHAAETTRELDQQLVDAQETRRILDRLYGYEVSPVLWKKVMPKLSAGRVQSVATRLLVQRERERIAFVAAGYWDIDAQCVTDGSSEAFPARLVSVDGRRVAQGRDFSSDGSLLAERVSSVVVLDEGAARGLAAALDGASFEVRTVDDKPYRRSPTAPFMTSTLQQEASRKLRLSSQTTMRVAQRLYENGYITYMRTDSTTLSVTALTAARAQARQLYGHDFVPEVPRRYERTVKNAQEAHEAIRPAGEVFRTPGEVAGEISRDEFALYELIWKRTVASQMADARGQTVSVRIGAQASDGKDVEFGTAGTVITFRGFLAAYEEGRDDDDTDAGRTSSRPPAERRLPPLSVGERLGARSLEPQGHTTTPPARYTEATLVRALEERGIGRPSTFASIISTILDRGYMTKRGSALVPTFLSFSVVGLLERYFGRLVDYDFTASMESDLDRIAGGDTERVEWLTRFYFGNGDGDPGLRSLVSDHLDAIDAREVNSISVGEGIVLRVGRYGPYVERDVGEETQRANVPETMAPDELTVAVAEELLAKPTGDRELGTDPASGHRIIAKDGRYGPYVTEVIETVEPTPKPKTRVREPKEPKPRTSSLLASMTLDTVDLDAALRLLSLPRTVGVDPADGSEIAAYNGRYGPYLKKGTDSRSLASEEQMFTVTLEEALAIYAQPKTRGRGRAAAALRELGADPGSGRPVEVREGRFGPYVTDGETNATLRKGDPPEAVTIDRAVELLAEKRAQGPAVKKPVAKKPAAKKPVAKKRVAAKKSPKKTATR
jgi:DNA topoisomerase I